jgi:hypothetical protein
MTSHIPAAMLRAVRERARDVCEYSRLDQKSQEATFHIDHIEPRATGGLTALDNLALACVSCSLRKGYRNKYRDPRTARRVRLFHPRRDKWDDHFIFTLRWQIRGRTAIGRATIAALEMNRTAIVAIRAELAAMGRFPSSQAQE